ncbi:MAG: RNA polymerase sigma factor [Psychrobium sp.]|nr:RNA polymerase sigma factor [Psychrobium sp.]
MDKKSNISSIFVSYTAKLRRVVSRIVRPEDIDDIVQDTFVRSYEAELKQEIKYARSYMLKTARNLALNHVAKSASKFNDSIEDFVEPPVELVSGNFEDEFESKERFLLFCQATDQLSGQVRKCFILKKVYGLSQKEIAKYLEISESTVEKHVAKGLLKSVQYMQQMDVEDNPSVKKSFKQQSIVKEFKSK